MPAKDKKQDETIIAPDQPKEAEENFLDDAVDDIAVTESNELLKVEDERLDEAFVPKDTSFKQRLQNFLKEWWQNPKKRWGTIGGAVILLAALLTVPVTRYFMLNSVGVRSSASVTILDNSTRQPLKNVSVRVAGAEATTDDNGVARLQKVKLGTAQLVVERRAFATIEKKITVGLGSNPLGELNMTPVGVQYSFNVSDFLSTKSIEKAEAVSGEFSAFSNSEGVVVLTIDQPGEDVLDVTIKATGYRDESLEQNADSKEAQAVAMVPARKHLFVSKRSGKYDVYKIDVDGKNEQLVLSGTGNERDDMSLVQHPDKDITALVSSRDSVRNGDGFVLSTLTLIDTSGEEVSTKAIGRSERIQIIGWSGDQLAYVQVAEGASAANPKRHRLITYNYANGDSNELAATNYFNDVLLVGNDIFYSPSSYQGGAIGLVKVGVDGKNQKTVFDQEVWNIFRTEYNKLVFSVQNDWYEYNLSDNKVLAASGAPASQISRIYIDGPEKKRSLWIDQRDGKGTLLAYTLDSKEDRVIKAQSGLAYPTVWVSPSTAAYRVVTEAETADYVVSLDGGEARKITNVTNTGGIDRWYYY